jgi:hypothetical protein
MPFSLRVRIPQKLRLSPVGPFFARQLLVGELALRILVNRFHVGVGRCRVDVEIDFLDIFAMISFWPAKTEQPLFQDVIVRVPKREREAQPALSVTNPQQSVFAPAISAAAGLVVRKVVPSLMVSRVILAHCSPLPLRQIRLLQQFTHTDRS